MGRQLKELRRAVAAVAPTAIPPERAAIPSGLATMTLPEKIDLKRQELRGKAQ